MQRTKDILKTWFERGDKPTEQQFSDLIDSFNQTIKNEENFQQENLEDGSTHVIKCALIVDLGAQPYTPWEADEGYEFIIEQVGIYELLKKHINKFPIYVKYVGNEVEYTWPTLVKVEEASITLQIKVFDSYDDMNNLFTATIGEDNQIHVKFATGQFKFLDENQIRAIELKGLVISPNAAISSEDSILSAFGKLQAQIDDLKARVSVLEDTPPPEPSPYIAILPDNISIPADGTAQEVQIAANGEWEAVELDS